MVLNRPPVNYLNQLFDIRKFSAPNYYNIYFLLVFIKPDFQSYHMSLL